MHIKFDHIIKIITLFMQVSGNLMQLTDFVIKEIHTNDTSYSYIE